ncbi:unnamed protein product, partial [Prorocentrum cordatum]
RGQGPPPRGGAGQGWLRAAARPLEALPAPRWQPWPSALRCPAWRSWEMPRRGRRRGDSDRGGGGPPEYEDEGGAAKASLSAQDGEAGGTARTKVFEKTKMCKFFILGCCTRGDACQFAHDKEHLANLPDLFRTKLCRSLINTGRCDNEDCRYAHSKEELRVVPGFSGTIGNPKIASDEVRRQ